MRQRGQAMVEFIIAFPVMILLIFGGLQFAFLYQAKTTLNYAAFQAARSGAVNNARFDAVAHGFASGMAPLGTVVSEVDLDALPGSGGSVTLERINKLNASRSRYLDDLDNENVCIERLNPPSTAFSETYATTDDDGNPSIPNDNLLYRSPTPGSLSGLAIQDANLLKLRITYCHAMIVPLVNDTIAALALASVPGEAGNWDPPPVAGGFRRQCLERGRLPIVAHGIVRMQSDPIDHPDDVYVSGTRRGFRDDCS